jgi:hypothetical protein
MGDYHIKRIVLPSGKTVEIVYYQADGGEPIITEAREVEPEGVELELRVRRIELCAGCGSERVHPVDWVEVADMRWELSVRCPDCEWENTDIYEQPEVERYDDVLNDATDRMIEELDRITRENMADLVERFRTALDEDGITPFDF